ncbi:MAG: cbb3-type cytochrome c oxidase N-terminal domain-containing protein [Phycisphaerales bacterium]
MSAHSTQQPGQPENLLDHEYDGIREFDNPTPGWWHAIFFGTVVFAAVYYFFVSFSPLASTPQGQIEAMKIKRTQKLFGAYGDLKPDTKTLLAMKEDKRMMSLAASLFVKNCATCHAADGGGINGLNLTDDLYKNVTTIEDIPKVLAEGRNAGAMPAWTGRLSENERVIVSSYVASLRGTKPANPKSPDPAEKAIAPWPATAP